MHAVETLALRGSLQIDIRRSGALIESWRDENMIMPGARDALARLIAGDGAGKIVTRFGVGTSADGPASWEDAALTTPFIKAVAGYSYPAPGRVQFDWRLETSEAVGLVIREFGLITSDGSLFARKTRAPIEKADDISLDGAWTIIF
ncbi:hypothetical protein [Neomegalonema sp.]|uniref:hypothetical protein n=1 Tax=Neomegalonema sp. TaxID=2039713 RepID=UPI0026203FF2|nr:hypothetical protein [Neomegalonema sp.]